MGKEQPNTGKSSCVGPPPLAEPVEPVLYTPNPPAQPVHRGCTGANTRLVSDPPWRATATAHLKPPRHHAHEVHEAHLQQPIIIFTSRNMEKPTLTPSVPGVSTSPGCVLPAHFYPPMGSNTSVHTAL